MKKLFILAAAAVCVGSAAYAQKPTKGNVTTEVNLNLTAGNTTDLYGGGLAFRYFLGDDAALSLGFVIATDKAENNFSLPDSAGTKTGTQTVSSSKIVFRPGYQKHFGGSDKVSPWVGVELPITLNSSKEEWENVDKDSTNNLGYADGVTNEVTGGSTSFGLTLNGGADWWFTDGMYLGVQVGWGFNSTTVKDTEGSYKSGSSAVEKPTPPGGKSGGFAAQTTGGIRFGFKF